MWRDRFRRTTARGPVLVADRPSGAPSLRGAPPGRRLALGQWPGAWAVPGTVPPGAAREHGEQVLASRDPGDPTGGDVFHLAGDRGGLVVGVAESDHEGVDHLVNSVGAAYRPRTNRPTRPNADHAGG